MRRILLVLAAVLAVFWGAGSPTAAGDPSAGTAHNHADAMFAMHMIPHHQQAIDMSDILLAKPNIDPRVADLANRIKAAQAPEIAQMQGWLDLWGMGGMGMMNMGGMASESEMAALRDAGGVDASRLYLDLMIPHHEGAITMAQNEIATGQFADEIALCRSIETSQQQEITEMQGILATL